MNKIVGVMGSGLIGTDPYAQDAWSGSSRFFFSECARQNLLHRAFGVDVDPLRRYGLMLRNFSPDRDAWRQHFYLDTAYYELLSAAIVASLTPEEAGRPLLQIGGIYDLKRRVGGSRAVYSYHDGNLAQALKNPQFPASVSRRHIERALAYERAVYEKLDLIFTMSEYLRHSFIEDFKIPPGKVRNIGAGVNLQNIPEVRDKDYEQKNILFVGADFARKGGMELLRAFKSVRSVFPSAKLCIAGPRELKIPGGLEAGVVALGFLSKNDPAQRQVFERALAEATLFTLPSLYEPFGIAPLEAMVYQIPAVLSNGWAFPEMVVPGKTGELVRVGDVDDLAEKIIHLLKDPDRLRDMGMHARRHVLDRFTWESVVSRLRAELSSV